MFLIFLFLYIVLICGLLRNWREQDRRADAQRSEVDRIVGNYAFFEQSSDDVNLFVGIKRLYDEVVRLQKRVDELENK